MPPRTNVATELVVQAPFFIRTEGAGTPALHGHGRVGNWTGLLSSRCRFTFPPAAGPEGTGGVGNRGRNAPLAVRRLLLVGQHQPAASSVSNIFQAHRELLRLLLLDGGNQQRQLRCQRGNVARREVLWLPSRLGGQQLLYRTARRGAAAGIRRAFLQPSRDSCQQQAGAVAFCTQTLMALPHWPPAHAPWDSHWAGASHANSSSRWWGSGSVRWRADRPLLVWCTRAEEQRMPPCRLRQARGNRDF